MTDSTAAAEKGSPAPKPEKAAKKDATLKSLAVSGSLWTFFGYGTQQAVRLGSNLIVTRLLFPEAYGLMTIVNIFMQGLAMLSDIGLGPSILQNKRGDEPDFLKTAWTIQVLRGLVITLVGVVAAWPVAWAYDEPMYVMLVPAACFSALLNGLVSTSLYRANRRLEMGSLTILDVVTNFVGVLVMIEWAFLYGTVWALVIAGLVSAALKLVASHLIFREPKMRFEWDRQTAREIIHFGKWIFLSSLLGFLVGSLDRIVLGKVITNEELGVYSIAFFWAMAGVQALQVVANKVLLPVYARLAELGRDRLRSRTFRIRAGLMGLTLPGLLLLVLFGDYLLPFLYDERYEGAGWIVRILAAGACVSSVTVTVSAVLLAVGDSFRYMLVLATRSILLVAAMAVGGHYYGYSGLIIGVAVSDLLNYPILVLCIRRYGVWLPLLDFGGFAVSGLVAYVAYTFMN